MKSMLTMSTNNMMRSFIAMIVVGWMVAEPLVAHATITWFWRAESTTLDGTHDYTAGVDTTGTTSGASIDASAALVGSNGVLVNASLDDIQFDGETAIHNRLAGSMAFWFRVQTWLAGVSLVYVRDSASGNNRIDVTLQGTSGSGDIRLTTRNTSATSTLDAFTSGANLAVDTTYFAVVQWDDANNDRRIAVYDSSGTLISENEDTVTDFNVPSSLGGTNQWSVGSQIAGATAFYIDNVFVGDAYTDGACFLTNRSITSYTSYSCGGAAHVPSVMLFGVGQ